ncbi:MAG: DUF4298 domain-containing protein [Firmicutes bacterium]|nr:DUF4298 domain-containing protein [Bacillota bacterium]
MRQTKQIKRIMQMEENLDAAKEALERFRKALDDYTMIQDTILELEAYYASDWRKDFEADEAGKLPEDLKRGVLSEDGLFDLLERARELDGNVPKEAPEA